MPNQERFPGSERIRKRSEYLDIYRKGKRTASRAFICYSVRHEGQGRKLGLAVSRKVGGAVVRNRVKRYIREIYRRDRLNLVEDISLVIVATPEAASLDYHECKDAIGQLLRRGDLFDG